MLPTFFAGVDAPLHINLLVRASEGWRGLGRVGKGQGGLKSVGNGQGRGGVIKGQGVLQRARKSLREPESVVDVQGESQSMLQRSKEC